MFPGFVRERSNVGRRKMERGRGKKKAVSSNKICLVLVVSYSSCARDTLRAWPFPLTPRPAGGTYALRGSVRLGGGIVLNSNLSKTLKDSANPGMANEGLCFYFFFSFHFCQSE